MKIEKPSMIVKFPFSVRQIADDSVEIEWTTEGVRLPFIGPQSEDADKFNRTFGVSLDEHEEILEVLNREYHRKLILATIKVL